MITNDDARNALLAAIKALAIKAEESAGIQQSQHERGPHELASAADLLASAYVKLG